MLDFIEKHYRLITSAGLLVMVGVEYAILNKMYDNQNKRTTEIYKESLRENTAKKVDAVGDSCQEEES